MLQNLGSCVTLIWIIYQHLHYNVLGVGTYVWDEFCYSYEFLCLEVKLHVCGMLLKMVEQLLRRRSHYVVNLIYLIKFVIARKQWEE